MRDNTGDATENPSPELQALLDKIAREESALGDLREHISSLRSKLTAKEKDERARRKRIKGYQEAARILKECE